MTRELTAKQIEAARKVTGAVDKMLGRGDGPLLLAEAKDALGALDSEIVAIAPKTHDLLRSHVEFLQRREHEK